VQLGEELWASEFQLRLGAGFYLPVRMTVVRAPSGGLILWSPGPIGDALASELAALGEVIGLVAPNCLHHLFAGDAQRRYPGAQLFAAPGLVAKRPDLTFDAGLEQAAQAWGGSLELLTIAGASRLGEVVALHRPSGSLIVTDLIFNMGDVRGFLTPWILRLAGVYRRTGQSRLIRLLVDDRAAAGESVRTMLDWPIRQVVPGHGAILGGADVHEKIKDALHWMLRAAPARIIAS